MWTRGHGGDQWARLRRQNPLVPFSLVLAHGAAPASRTRRTLTRLSSGTRTTSRRRQCDGAPATLHSCAGTPDLAWVTALESDNDDDHDHDNSDEGALT
jgi:hypothetical protein